MRASALPPQQGSVVAAVSSGNDLEVLRLSRLVQWESQAIAQNHQGPQRRVADTAGLGTAAANEPHASAAGSSGNDQSASIIAPGREGSQLGGAESPRPADFGRPAGLGTAARRAAPSAAVSEGKSGCFDYRARS